MLGAPPFPVELYIWSCRWSLPGSGETQLKYRCTILDQKLALLGFSCLMTQWLVMIRAMLVRSPQCELEVRAAQLVVRHLRVGWSAGLHVPHWRRQSNGAMSIHVARTGWQPWVPACTRRMHFPISKVDQLPPAAFQIKPPHACLHIRSLRLTK